MGSALSFFSSTTDPDSARIGRASAGAADTAVSQTGAEDATQANEQQPQPKTDQPANFEDRDGCGIDEDWDQYPPSKGPQRIKTSILSEAERITFQGHVDHIFSEAVLMGEQIVFDPDDIVQVFVKIIEYLKSEPTLIEDIPYGVVVVADLHGQLFDLDRIFRLDEKEGKPGWECAKYLFLGDYVDRGRQSIEIVMGLFCLKMLHPDRIFLLRGNHEFIPTNCKYGNIYDFSARYEVDTAALLYLLSNQAFSYLSLAAIVGDNYFCAHGGISPSASTRQQFRGIPKPIPMSTDDVLSHDSVWADPAQGLTGVTFNSDRMTSVYFGIDALCHAMEALQVAVVLRGHSKLKAGWECSWGMLFSLFSCTNADPDLYNDGAVAYINERGKLTIRVLKVHDERQEWEKKLRGGKVQEPDEKTTMGGCDGNTTGRLTRL